MNVCVQRAHVEYYLYDVEKYLGFSYNSRRSARKVGRIRFKVSSVLSFLMILIIILYVQI